MVEQDNNSRNNTIKRKIAVMLVILGGTCIVAVLPYFSLVVVQWFKGFPNWSLCIVGIITLSIGILLFPTSKHIHSTNGHHNTYNSKYPKKRGISVFTKH